MYYTSSEQGSSSSSESEKSPYARDANQNKNATKPDVTNPKSLSKKLSNKFNSLIYHEN